MEGREGKGRRVPHLDLNPGDATGVVQVLMGHFIFLVTRIVRMICLKIVKTCLNLSKLRPKYCRSLFSGHGVLNTVTSLINF